MASGPLRRRRAFEPGRVREGPVSLAVAELLLGLVGLAVAALAFFTGWVAYLGARPQDPALHHRLAGFHLQSGELPQAVVELRRVLALRPDDRRAQQELAAALKRQGRFTEARQGVQFSSQVR